jgi:hypothetical protein
MNAPTNKAKGDLLEDVITSIRSRLVGSTVTRNAKLPGRNSGADRDVDVLIEGRLNMFDVRIAIEAKNYKNRVGVEKVEALCTKLRDIGADLGVMVSSMGFTEPAKAAALANDIQLYEVYDQRLDNTSLFLPVRLVLPEPDQLKVQITHRTFGRSSLPADHSRWLIHAGEERLAIDELVGRAWADGLIPPTPGMHVFNVGGVVIEDAESPSVLQYCDLTLAVQVRERFYLKLFPASFIKRSSDGREAHKLHLDMHLTHDQMVASGWKEFATHEQMEEAAAIPNQPDAIRGLLLRPRVQGKRDE